jgi:hypothetical protein
MIPTVTSLPRHDRAVSIRETAAEAALPEHGPPARPR